MKMSWDTFELLCSLGDRDAWKMKELIWDLDNDASRNGEIRPSTKIKAFRWSSSGRIDFVWV